MSAVPQPMPSLGTQLVRYSYAYKEQVLELARQMHEESAAHSGMALDRRKLAERLGAAAESSTAYVMLAVRDGTVLGGFLGTITGTFFSDELAAKDLAWFVSKERRGSVAAVTLVRDFERWARAMGAKRIFLGQSTGVDIEKTRALYEHLGYRTVGFNAVKEC